ncbi:hypothetical protein JW968_04760 [Candidatus Woesearchaeota archaeon]|nr:hypothetical protein [Candidatus Woesearchaeota archaeon]
MQKDIVITYETLFDLLRREKSRVELQKLDREFFKDVVDYLKDKEKMMADDVQEDLFSFGEKEKAQKQLFNIRRILRELYDRREKKVLSMAADKAKTGSKLIDTGSLLPQERQLFDSVVNTLLLFRTEIIQKLIEVREVKESIHETENYFDQKERLRDEKKLSEIFREITPAPEKDDEDTLGDYIPDSGSSSGAVRDPVAGRMPTAGSGAQPEGMSGEPKEDAFITLRFLQHVPKFVGLELEEYGPFSPDDMANIPEILANVLIEKRRAELVSNS